ncbi:MAG: hypothetical protein JW726_06805 [Anaerolineales bacterium]|nr:hypothetical protein [Anaerolineales bacterium]
MKIVRASEIGTYLFCQRAWWYDRQGMARENQAELAGGNQLHERHGQIVMASGCLRSVAVLLLLAAVVLLAISLVELLL